MHNLVRRANLGDNERTCDKSEAAPLSFSDSNSPETNARLASIPTNELYA